jgi:hypothetical protein
MLDRYTDAWFTPPFVLAQATSFDASPLEQLPLLT